MGRYRVQFTISLTGYKDVEAEDDYEAMEMVEQSVHGHIFNEETGEYDIEVVRQEVMADEALDLDLEELVEEVDDVS